MKTFLRTFFFLVLVSSLNAQQVPDFTMTDVNGNEHSLYADYLDQGIPVFISVAATWNPWDSVWVNSGVMDEFQATYGNDAAIMFIEGDTFTAESELYGTGPSSNYDYVTGHDYLIMDDSAGIMQSEFGITYFPFIIMICPDGTGYTQNGTNVLNADPDVFYGYFETADLIADKMFEHCGTDFDRSKLTGVVYTDMNTDCDESGEQGVPMVVANITGPNGSFYKITDNDGEFRSLADDGTYSVEVVSPGSLWDVCDNPQSYTFSGSNDSTYMDFGLQANMQCTDPTVDISAPFFVRCFESNIYVHYCNEGTIPMNDAVVTVTLDSFLYVDNVSIMPTSQNGFTYTFDLGTLGVFECGDIVFDITVDCDVELGTEQCFDAQISPEMGCNNNSNLLSDSEECQDIVGSYDPNDKRAYPFQDSDDYSIGPNERIKYQIRFQNTGTFMAFKVEVKDQISPNMDLSTFRMGNASHDYEVFIEEDRTLRVVFDNIMLQDSFSNEPASHGFFTYYLDQLADLPDGTKIENQAGIYFDFNDPVITNTTIHTVDYNIVSIHELDESKLGFSFSPNPVNDLIQISLDGSANNSGQYNLTNISGQHILSGAFNARKFEIPVKEIGKGIYFLRLVGDDGAVGVRKVLIQ